MNVDHQAVEKSEYVCTQEDEGTRLDVFLAAKLPITRSQIKGLICNNHILVNGSVVKAGYRLKINDRISVACVEPQRIELKPENIKLDIVYQDQDLAVINKQPGLVVHPGAGNMYGTLVNALLYHCLELSSIGGELRPGIVHRLDKDTTGLMLIAKNDHTHKNLAIQIKQCQVKRNYLALVHGIVKNDQGKIEQAIGRHPKDRKRMAVKADGRHAVTHYIVRERISNKYSLLECQLQTGRTHQIRVHLAAVNHPIVGDKVYGIRKNNLGSSRQMLHSFHLGFNHPKRGWMDFYVDLPQDFSEILDKARKIS